jgi:hypothetical protein
MRCIKKSDQFFPAGNKNSVNSKSEFKHYHDLPGKHYREFPAHQKNPNNTMRNLT